MVLLNYTQQAKFFMGRKRFGYRQADKDQTRTYAEALLENPDAGFYRLRHFEGMLLHERLPFYKPYNPQTVAQQDWRSVFADAIALWHTFNDGEKLFWKVRGEKKRLPGYNAFISFYLETHKL